jgi:hypothetical protein
MKPIAWGMIFLLEKLVTEDFPLSKTPAFSHQPSANSLAES